MGEWVDLSTFVNVLCLRSKTCFKPYVIGVIPLLYLTAELNPLLLSVFAQNKSYLSVQIAWRLTEHAVFSACHVSLRLRLLNSSSWSQEVTNLSQILGFYTFAHLQPRRMYLLNITLQNKYKQIENRAVVFWSAASNSSGMSSHYSLWFYCVS